ncbi:thermostable hemolysin [Pseudomonas sp. TE3610]
MTSSAQPPSLPLRLCVDGKPTLELIRALPQDTARPVLEQFVQRRFLQTHGARIQTFMPELVGLVDEQSALHAVAGLRYADQAALFLERYLDAPIEDCLQDAIGITVPRNLVIEVGNLAAADSGSARLSIITITWLLAVRGLHWVVFTGGQGLVNSFHRLGLRPVTLCEADPARLGDERLDWGQYYQSRPHVHYGDIRAGFHHLHRTGLFKRLGLPDPQECHGHVA